MDIMSLVSFLVGLGIMLFLMLKTKLGPFASMLFAALIIGIGAGLGGTGTVGAILDGFSGIIRSIGIVIIFGTILGEYLEKSNASQRIATTLLKLTGVKKSPIAMAATGFIVSIPVFSDVAMVMLSPIVKAVAKKAARTVAPLAVALALGLLNTNALVAPTPAPLSVAAVLDLDIGVAIFWGIIAAAAATIASLIFCMAYLGKKPESWYTYAESDLGMMEAKEEVKEIAESDMPSFFSAILPILVPVLLIVGNTTAGALLPADSAIRPITSFIGNSNIALAIGCIVAAVLLIKRLPNDLIFSSINSAMRSCGPIIFITAAGGALAGVIGATGLGEMFADFLVESPLPIVLIPFMIAALVRFAQGSGGVAAIMGATLTAPLAVAGVIHPVVVFLAACSGAQVFSHVNNSFFWVFANLFGYDVKTTFKTLVVGQWINGLAGLAVAIVASLFL